MNVVVCIVDIASFSPDLSGHICFISHFAVSSICIVASRFFVHSAHRPLHSILFAVCHVMRKCGFVIIKLLVYSFSFCLWKKIIRVVVIVDICEGSHVQKEELNNKKMPRKSKWVEKKSSRIQTILQIVCDSSPFADFSTKRWARSTATLIGRDRRR